MNAEKIIAKYLDLAQNEQTDAAYNIRRLTNKIHNMSPTERWITAARCKASWDHRNTPNQYGAGGWATALQTLEAMRKLALEHRTMETAKAVAEAETIAKAADEALKMWDHAQRDDDLDEDDFGDLATNIDISALSAGKALAWLADMTTILGAKKIEQ